MIKELFQKIICSHNWKTHSKDVYTWETANVVPKTEFWFRPLVNTRSHSRTVETLICTKCGKIEKIKHDTTFF